MNIQGIIDPGKSVMYSYAAISLAGFYRFHKPVAQKAGKILYIYCVLTTLSIAFFFNIQNTSPAMLYFACALLGFSTSFWSMFVTMAAEQFGTNIRATVANRS